MRYMDLRERETWGLFSSTFVGGILIKQGVVVGFGAKALPRLNAPQSNFQISSGACIDKVWVAWGGGCPKP